VGGGAWEEEEGRGGMRWWWCGRRRREGGGDGVGGGGGGGSDASIPFSIVSITCDQDIEGFGGGQGEEGIIILEEGDGVPYGFQCMGLVLL